MSVNKPYDVVIVGTGPAGLGAAFELLGRKPDFRILMLDRNEYSSGGLRNDCKMNFSWPIGFPEDCWEKDSATEYLDRVERFLEPTILEKRNLDLYAHRAEKIGASLLSVRQSHLGTDGGLDLIKRLIARLKELGAEISLGEQMLSLDAADGRIVTDKREIRYRNLVLAPGRSGFSFLQDMMKAANITYKDNVVDVGIRIETREEHYPIVRDYYDPKFLFPKKTRTFCTNSRAAHVVQERYGDAESGYWYSVNGHAWSSSRPSNGLANFAMLKTVTLTEPLASGQAYARMLGVQAALIGGGRPIMQRVGDFRLGKRSFASSFNGDLYDFEPTLASCTPGDIGLSAPAKVLRALWNGMKMLDSIVPGLLHPSTIMYYPEIKLYANRPVFADRYFRAAEGLYLIGDGAGTSRGITAAWASGLRAADGILAERAPGT
ncbi:MAG: FAD-dependent oxidoreductase [Rectinema sp.]